MVALCDLRPYAGGGADWWVASDLAELATGKPLREDHVLGIGGASTTLASWTPRPHVERALDLGTGCGVQALHLDAHADEIVRDLVRAVGDHLEPGGIAQFLGNWEVPVGATWTERVTAWLDGTGLDAWVVQREVQDPAQYAETWARDGGHHPGTADFNTMYAAWLDDFEARDVASIGFGVITLQRPRTDRDPFVDLMDVPWPVESPMGATVLAGLDARTWLTEADDDAVLDAVWTCAADVHEERHTTPGSADPRAIVLRQVGGLRRHLTLTTVTAAFSSVCDGDLSARVAAAAISGLLDVDGSAVRAEVAAFVRDAAKDGLITR